jgi:FlaG/FlaF family flagellin (archaellin)
MVAIVVILAATISVIVLDFTEDLDDPAPNVADTTGEFVIDDPEWRDTQFVLITHRAGESVAVEDIEIVVRVDASDDDDFPKEARLVDFPDPDENDPDNIIDSGESDIGFDTWRAGQTIEFRINTGTADFRIDENNTGPEADELEVLIVHTPSNSILSEHTFNP